MISSRKPNILLIMTDEQRGDCLGVEGHPCLLTPNLDELAAGGMRFERAYSTCPVCIPARREHAGDTPYAFHTLTDGREKYIWFTQTGREQFFDLRDDPQELHDLAQSPRHVQALGVWREKLIRKIAGRGEGFVRAGKLIPGRPHTGNINCA